MDSNSVICKPTIRNSPTDYYREMINRNRMIVLMYGDECIFMCTLFFLEGEWQLKSFMNRDMWSTPEDYESGPIVYIDQLAGFGFDKEMFGEIEKFVIEMNPLYEKAIWVRPKKDMVKIYRYTRRSNGYLSHQNCNR